MGIICEWQLWINYTVSKWLKKGVYFSENLNVSYLLAILFKLYIWLTLGSKDECCTWFTVRCYSRHDRDTTTSRRGGPASFISRSPTRAAHTFSMKQHPLRSQPQPAGLLLATLNPRHSGIDRAHRLFILQNYDTVFILRKLMTIDERLFHNIFESWSSLLSKTLYWFLFRNMEQT